jgi:hypothetical protein
LDRSSSKIFDMYDDWQLSESGMESESANSAARNSKSMETSATLRNNGSEAMTPQPWVVDEVELPPV